MYEVKAVAYNSRFTGAEIDEAVEIALGGLMPMSGGTFTGAVMAGALYQAPGSFLLRNTRLVPEEAAPAAEGEICWIYG